MFGNWFTNKCQAYVGSDGRVLSGPALEAAKQDPKARRCGARVKVRAKFCRSCGSPAPGGWWRCGACGKWIGNESETCSHCGHTQNAASRVNLDNGVWSKGDDVFAQRFELNDIEALLKNGLVIQEGQCAILLANGRIAEVLPPGRYPAAELVDMEHYFHSGDRKALVMVELAEIAFPVLCTGLRSKEDMDLDLTCSVLLRFNPECAEEFLANVMGSHVYVSGDDINAVLGYDDLARNLLLSEVEIAAKDVCNEHAVDDLFKDPQLRIELEDRIADQLKRNLDAAGLKFMRLSEVEFHGTMFERLRDLAGDVERKRRELEFQLRADQITQDSAKREALGEIEVEDYLDQLAHEKDIKDYVRAQEMARFNEIWERDRAIADLNLKYEQARKELTDTSELETLQAEHDEALKAIVQGGEIERRRREHAELIRQRLEEQNASLGYERIEIEIQKMRHDAALAAARDKLDLEKTRRADERENEAERAKTLSGLGHDILTRISLAKDPAEAHYLMKAFKAMQRDGKDPMQLLAEAAADGNTDAAAALANLSNDRIGMLEDVRRAEREMSERQAERMERMFNKAADALSGKNSGGGNR